MKLRGDAPQPSSTPSHTHGVQLVQLMVDEGRVSSTGAGIRPQGTVPPQAPSLARQPAAHPQSLQQVANEVPEQTTGQVQVGGGQGPAQCPQGQPQLLSSLGKVPLGTRRVQVRNVASGCLICLGPQESVGVWVNKSEEWGRLMVCTKSRRPGACSDLPGLQALMLPFPCPAHSLPG